MSSLLDRRRMLHLLAVQGIAASVSRWVGAEDQHVPLNEDYVQRRRREQDASVGLANDIELAFPGLEMCWVVPPRTVLVQGKHPRWAYLESNEYAFRWASFEAQLSSERLAQMAKEFPEAVCDPSATWFAYRTARSVRKARKVLGMPVVSSGVAVGASRDEMNREAQSRDYPVAAGLRLRVEALLSADKRYRFVQHARYASDSNEVRELGIALYSGDWRSIARQVWTHSAGASWCDGCQVPVFDSGLAAVFRYFNMLAHPDIRYPLLVLDTSTVESRTLELSTFSEDGRFARVPRTQIVIGCPSFQVRDDLDAEAVRNGVTQQPSGVSSGQKR